MLEWRCKDDVLITVEELLPPASELLPVRCQFLTDLEFFNLSDKQLQEKVGSPVLSTSNLVFESQLIPSGDGLQDLLAHASVSFEQTILGFPVICPFFSLPDARSHTFFSFWGSSVCSLVPFQRWSCSLRSLGFSQSDQLRMMMRLLHNFSYFSAA